jgi:hypothetical protein
MSLLAVTPLAGCGEPTEEEEPTELSCVEPTPKAEDGATDFELVDAADGELQPRFEPGDDGFYRMPWPSDARVTAEGTVDISDIAKPGNGLVSRFIDTLATIEGFSTMPVAYIPFGDGGAPQDLPEPADTLQESSSVQLLNLGEHCGERVPVEAVWDEEGDDFIAANTLKVAPVAGAALRPAAPYAVIVTTDFGAQGTARPAAFAEHLRGDGSDEALSDSYEPLRACLSKLRLSADAIAVASVFTTQDPTAEARRMRGVVWSESTPLEPIADWEKWEDESRDDYTTYRGVFEAPIFQRGEPPYQTEGDLEIDQDGSPVIQRWEEVPFAVTVPAGASGPLKLLVWVGGTGAVLDSHIGRRHTNGLLDEGFAVASFVPQFHEGRGEGQFDTAMDTFNYLNPPAGRTVFRQQVAETSYFIRLLEHNRDSLDGLPEIDTERVYYGGHSQGALVGAMVAGVEPRIDTYLLNGVGSYLSETVVFRKDPFDIEALVRRTIGVDRKIDRFHPAVQMAQLGADVVDPHNYARHWTGWPDHPDGSHIFVINGQDDDTTSTTSMNALMHVGGLPVVGTAGWDVDPRGVFDHRTDEAPVSHNSIATSCEPRTFGAFLSADDGHFTLYYNSTAESAALEFWASSSEGKAIIDL